MIDFVVISTGPFEAHAKAALLCHSFREYLTLSLTTWVPSISDIPEVQEDCLRVLFSGRTPSCQHIFFWTHILFPAGFPR